MSSLINSIIMKWRTQGSFIRFIDGDKRNCTVSNLCYVSLEDAMNHIDDWVVDWDAELTRNEIRLVKTKKFRDGLR